jgi:hypothetical protein
MNPHELSLLKDKLWSETVSSECNPFDILLWRTAAELGSMIEFALEPHEFTAVAPEALEALDGVDHYFENRAVLRPHSVLLVLLKLRRHQAGLPDR